MLPDDDIMDVFLQPGELYFGDSTTRIRTLLGSCLAITFWHPLRRLGGMCHCLLPSDATSRSRDEPDPRYVDEALMMLLREAMREASNPSEYQIKLFGGADMFGAGASMDRIRIGEKNAVKATQIIGALGLNIVARDIGGGQHRSLIFEVGTGDVWVSRGRRTEDGDEVAA